MKKFLLAFLFLSLSALIFTPRSHALTFPGDFQIDSIQGSSLYWSNFIANPGNPNQGSFNGCGDGVGIFMRSANPNGYIYYQGGADNCTLNGATFFDFSTLPIGQYYIRVTAVDSNSVTSSWENYFYCNGTFCSGLAVNPVTATPSQTQANTPINISSSFTDLFASGSYFIDVDWGDGNVGGYNVTEPSGSGSVTSSHTYTTAGVYTVILRVYNNAYGGVHGQASTTVTVTANNPPTVNSITVSPNPVQVNTAITVSASFTDADVSDTHTATANWGDTTTSCTVTETNGSGSVSCPRSSGYSAANVYPVSVTVSDGSASGTSPVEYASVYNPTAQGLFSGAHKFTSPAGAYAQNTSLTGDVTFGLSYKYQGTIPVGDKQFTMNFKNANLLFNATTVSTLVISNSMATLTGSGTINGSGNYNFLVTGVNGGDIRIQITDPSNNNSVIYDTQPGAATTATPTTSVTGNIIVHN